MRIPLKYSIRAVRALVFVRPRPTADLGAPDYGSRGQESAGGSFKMCRWLPAADCDPIPTQVRLKSGLFSAVVRLLPAHDSLCAPFRRAELGDEEVSQRTYLRWA